MGLLRVALLSFLPSLGATAGAMLDESRQLGFSTWRSACRADGVSFGSVLSFTWQLLPNAITGLLLGGLAVLALGFAGRQRGSSMVECAAAHTGCVLAMPLGLMVCAQSLPAIVMPVTDALLATAAALLVLRLLARQRGPARIHP